MTASTGSSPPPPPRKAAGSYATPLWLARALVTPAVQALAAGRTPTELLRLRVLEPAVGDGVMLMAVLEALETAYLAAGGRPGVALARFRRRIVQRSLLGVDRAAGAVARARARLAGCAGVLPTWESLHVGDGLQDDARSGLSRGVDLVVSNPPFVSARVAARAGQDRVSLQRRFRTARGAFDLAAAFAEQALGLVRPGGRLALVLPRSLCATQHGAPLRELLTTTATITALIDVSSHRAFGPVAVYPVLLRAVRQAPRAHDHVVDGLGADPLPHRVLEETAPVGFPVGVPPQAADVALQRQAAGVPLAQLADLFAMTTGFDARRTASRLRERAQVGSAAGVPFVTTRNVGSFTLRRGPIRYQRRLWEDPILLPGDGARACRDQAPKLLVAGMGRQLRAAWCPTAVAGGVSVYGVVPRAGVDPHLLLGCLNAPCLTEVYGCLFPGKRLAGGYLAVNRHTLALLPVVPPDRPQATDIARLARRLDRCEGEDGPALQELDQLVRLGLS